MKELLLAVTTVLLSYATPQHGYTAHYVSVGSAGGTITVDETVDAHNNREADVSLDAGRNSFKHHYMQMDGLFYVRGSDGVWQFDAGQEAAVLSATLAIGGYWPPTMLSGATVSKQGTGPCEASTCDLYLASLTTLKSDKPQAQVSHIAIDPTSRLLVSTEMTMFDASGAIVRDAKASFGGFGGQRLTVPAVTLNSTAKSDCRNGTLGSDAVELCLIRGYVYTAMYTLSVNGALVMRAGGTSAATGRTSPVRDDVFLKCDRDMRTQDIDSKLAATLKQSGMSDSQIESQLGQAQTGSDCTVSINDQTALTAHYDF